MANRFEIFTDLDGSNEQITDLIEHGSLTLQESCDLLNKQDNMIQDYKFKRDSWKRTAGEEMSKAVRAETRLEILEFKIKKLHKDADNSYNLNYEDYCHGLVDAYKEVLTLFKESEKTLKEV